MWQVAEGREEGFGFFIILLKLRMNEKKKKLNSVARCWSLD